MPGEEALDEALGTAAIHVLEPGRPACQAVTQDRITWGPIPVSIVTECGGLRRSQRLRGESTCFQRGGGSVKPRI